MELKTRKDILLMTYFRKNARENLTQISRLTRIPVSTIFDKLREFEKGLIQKHTTLIDFRMLGFDIRVNILFRITNGYDYLVEAIFKDMTAMQKFSELLDRFKIESKQELFILEDIKRESFLSDELHAKLLL